MKDGLQGESAAACQPMWQYTPDEIGWGGWDGHRAPDLEPEALLKKHFHPLTVAEGKVAPPELP